MTAPVISDPVQREAAYRRVEQLMQEAAEAERAAYLRWQEAYGAYEVARDEASAEWTAWVEAIAPLHPSISGTRGAVMSVRRGEHAPKCPHRRLIGAGASGAIGYRCSGGEC